MPTTAVALRRLRWQSVPMTSRLGDLWCGRFPLGTAFWNYMIFWGFLLNVAATVAAMAVLVAAGGDAEQRWAAWLSLTFHLLPLPYNTVCLVGVWRSAAAPEVGPTPRLLARLAAVLWSAAMVAA